EIFYHPTEDRYLTPREYMRIHGFPDNYVLRGPIRRRSGSVKDLDQHRQIGNSVPPPLAKVVATKIKEVISTNYLSQLCMYIPDTLDVVFGKLR
ncbi:MAG: DNA cytosine methyltransferase, partial [Alphaproteobacteria bacterium]|nr:DNA cytosine methyltransferase [Alphaproteobacteria bacterium]